MGTQNDTATFENRLAVSYKVKYIFTIRPRKLTLRYLSKINKNLCSKKNLFMTVYSSFVHYHQKLEITQMNLNWWKYWLVEYYSTIKRNEILIHVTTGLNSKSIMARWIKPDSKVYLLYGILVKAKTKNQMSSQPELVEGRG